MENLLCWSDIRTLYYFVSYGGLILLCIIALYPVVTEKTVTGSIGTFVFLALLCLWVIASRWPSIFHFVGWSIDEDQFLAAARTLIDDPVFFRSTEAGSSGPLNIYPLLFPRLLGIYPTLMSGRIVGLIMICGSLISLYLCLRIFLTPKLSKTVILVPASFFGLTTYWDFQHYTSELCPVFLMTLGLAIVARVGFSAPQNFPFWVFKAMSAAVILSLVPFAKLQATYLALGIGLLLVISVLFQNYYSKKERALALLAIVISALIFPLAFSFLMIRCNTFDYFIKSYFLNATAYVHSGHTCSYLELLKRTILGSTEFCIILSSWALLITLAIAIALFIKKGYFHKKHISIISASIFLVLLASFTIVAPRRNWPHYLMFAPIFMTLLLAASIMCLAFKINQNGNEYNDSRKKDVILSLLIVITCILPFAGAARTWISMQEKPYSKIGIAILNASLGQNKYVAIWGYNPNYYGETGLKQSTRLSISSAQFNENNLKEFFRNTYLEDLKKNRPGVFVDATSVTQFPALNDPVRFRHELVTGVCQFVSQNYELKDVVDGVRIYQWSDHIHK